ncbi:hypothetical protein [Alcaligenes faecalis]|uniref:hypothetical protein n=1 Tax=Alcaligenes faecalis TaxID=511 RepID=UPI00214FB44E|nr:hypothetical protein [Alcaligenes faecalis]MCR4145639.1 hypothetical protein [Alcaligenes faecalis]
MRKTELQAAAEAAQASVELEGIRVPEDALVEAEKFIEGKISFQELVSHLYRQAKNSSAGNH